MTDAVQSALTAQKDALLSRIQSSDTASQFDSILDALAFAAPLWAALGHGQKVREVGSAVIAAAKDSRTKASVSRDATRKGGMHAEFCGSVVARLNVVIARAERICSEN